MSTAHAIENLSYDVFVNEWPQQTNGLLPNGEPRDDGGSGARAWRLGG